MDLCENVRLQGSFGPLRAQITLVAGETLGMLWTWEIARKVKVPESGLGPLGEGAKGFVDPASKRPLALVQKWGLHRCKWGFGCHGAKDSWETFAPWPPRRPKRPFAPSPTLILLQKYRDTNGSRIVIQIGGVYTTFCQEGGHTFAKVWRYKWEVYRDAFQKYRRFGVRGRLLSLQLQHK